jgi:hypothetical protein
MAAIGVGTAEADGDVGSVRGEEVRGEGVAERGDATGRGEEGRRRGSTVAAAELSPSSSMWRISSKLGDSSPVAIVSLSYWWVPTNWLSRFSE